MPYVFLAAAIAVEVFATSMLKVSAGFTRVWPTVACLAGYVAAFGFLAQAAKAVPIGVAYALWAGLGTAAIVAVAAVFLGEPITWIKVVGISLIVAGVVILNLGTTAQ